MRISKCILRDKHSDCFGVALMAFVTSVKLKLHRARLVLGLVTTFGGFAIQVFIQATEAHSAWPSLHGMSTGDDFTHLWEETVHQHCLV